MHRLGNGNAQNTEHTHTHTKTTWKLHRIFVPETETHLHDGWSKKKNYYSNNSYWLKLHGVKSKRKRRQHQQSLFFLVKYNQQTQKNGCSANAVLKSHFDTHHLVIIFSFSLYVCTHFFVCSFSVVGWCWFLLSFHLSLIYLSTLQTYIPHTHFNF